MCYSVCRQLVFVSVSVFVSRVYQCVLCVSSVVIVHRTSTVNMPTEPEYQEQIRILTEQNQHFVTATQQQQAALEALQTQYQQLLANSAQVGRVSVKLPVFWADKPAVWFASIESQFRTARITADQTKYDHVVGQLDPRVSAEVEDILTGPDTNKTYENLKAKLIERLSLSETKRIQQLLSDQDLGDKKPTQFLRHLRSLAGTQATVVSDNLLRTLWMGRLPPSVSAILTSHTDLDLDKLAALADKIVEVAPPPAPVFAVSKLQQGAAGGSANIDLAEQMQQLSAQIAALTKQVQEKPSFRSRSRSRGRGGANRSRSNNNNNSGSNGGGSAGAGSSSKSGMCWYHATWGDDARKCEKPCNYVSGN